MIFLILLILVFLAFAVYRYKKYQKQREIEEMAADAQAYVSSEVVELLQRSKTLLLQQPTSDAVQNAQKGIQNLTENLFCHTDSEASVREYLSAAKQEIALLNNTLDQISAQIASNIQDVDD
ncbi:MAG: hypothetical protein E6Q25_03130 [Acinetobacter sp.]|jgi:hypothetical protein|nr:MAG: hypothetical protein E6Q25_03130 [Acinetobacter sp.]